MYKLFFEKEAKKEFLNLPVNIKQIIKEKLGLLCENPILLKHNIKPLKGQYKGLKRLPVGSYRVIFQEKAKELIIIIIRTSSRKNAY
jgi:mRNA interferase RelE/StbE